MEFETIPARDLNRYVRDRHSVIIDLRSPEEYQEAHIMGAVNIPFEELEKGLPYSRAQELVLYCERGSTSMAAARELAEKNYRVKSVVGGIHAYRGPYLVEGKRQPGREYF
ncbi:MAG: rhodanese-like domain-containing protein [Lachnospiraceae bacterium]|nr:rhodanese-like domain-containing protein [Lachnospiraceae bacterium]